MKLAMAVFWTPHTKTFIIYSNEVGNGSIWKPHSNINIFTFPSNEVGNGSIWSPHIKTFSSSENEAALAVAVFEKDPHMQQFNIATMKLAMAVFGRLIVISIHF